MRAKMSNREARANEFDAIERASWMLPADGEWTCEDLWARDAEREARAILAETEPSREDHCTHPDQDSCDCDWCRYLRNYARYDNRNSYRYLHTVTIGNDFKGGNAHTALAESLAAFVS